jgi:hypothetical protein
MSYFLKKFQIPTTLSHKLYPFVQIVAENYLFIY